MDEKHNCTNSTQPIVRLEEVPIGGTFKRETIKLPAGSSLYDLYEVIKGIPGASHKLVNTVTLIYEESH